MNTDLDLDLNLEEMNNKRKDKHAGKTQMTTDCM